MVVATVEYLEKKLAAAMADPEIIAVLELLSIASVGRGRETLNDIYRRTDLTLEATRNAIECHWHDLIRDQSEVIDELNRHLGAYGFHAVGLSGLIHLHKLFVYMEVLPT